MELIGKFAGNDTSTIEIIPSASKHLSIKFADQFIHMINNKDRLNGFKGITKIQHKESLFKYQSRFNNAQSNNG